eukprot:tig00000851_g4891.t1
MFFAVLAAGQRGLDDREILGDLPPHLQNEIARYLNREILQKVPLFSNADTGFLSELVTRLKPRLYGPGEYIVPYGEVGREMFFISRGVVEVCSEDGRVVFKCMADGEYFGEIALLYSDKRTASVRAKGYCDLFTLNREDLEAVLVDYPKCTPCFARSRMTGGHVPQKKPASAIMNGNTGSARSQIRRTSSVTAMGNSVGRGTLSRSSSFNDQNRMAQVQRAQWALRTIRRFIHAWILIHRSRKAGNATAEPLRMLLDRKASSESMSHLLGGGTATPPAGASPAEKGKGLAALLPQSRSFTSSSKAAQRPESGSLARRRSNSLPAADPEVAANAAAAAAALAAAASATSPPRSPRAEGPAERAAATHMK